MSSLLDALIDALKNAATYNQNDMVSPVAVLWPDAGREWQEVVPVVAEHLPLLTLGEYDPAQRTGPAIWIRCVLAQTLPDPCWPSGTVPVIYLPGFSRADLRAAEDSPAAIQPLAELQYRGGIWSQKNGRDWTLAAFLQSAHGGLGIPVASDGSTQEALRRSAPVLLGEPVATLRANAPLRADFINGLLAPDVTRQVLLWMNDPEGEAARISGPAWEAFCDQCRQELGLDPERDGEVSAAEKLGKREGGWEQVWRRFREAPRNYPQVPDLLRRARPVRSGIVSDGAPSESWPQDNEIREGDLRDALAGLKSMAPENARATLARLEQEHGYRRAWVWAELGHSPLAAALRHLVDLSDRTATLLSGYGVEGLAGQYAAEAWKTDAAALNALACVREAKDLDAVAGALAALYMPWLRHACEVFQDAWRSAPPQVQRENRPPEAGAILLFTDGLRLDLANALVERLAEKGLACEMGHALAAIPTITETAKPAVSPVAGELAGGAGLSPNGPHGSPVNAVSLRKLLGEHGFQTLSLDETGDPSSAAWTEIGRLDEIGHLEGWRISYRAGEELDGIVRRVRELVDAGWREVRIITDHGWLLMPGDMQKCELPEQATEIRKGRCARLKPGAHTDCQVVAWHWAPSIEIAVAPGMKCFVGGKSYEHGGISPQETIIPVLTVRSTETRREVAFGEVKWVGLRCRIQLIGAFEGLSIDLRTKPADPSTSIADTLKPISGDGTGSLVCPDDALEGNAAVLVVCTTDAPHKVLAQQLTVIGGK